jgi:16S rRNA (cytosine1402-N4)-methyltransferase
MLRVGMIWEFETKMSEAHVPVLYRETIEMLQPRPGGRYLDGTLGAGGHAAAILQASAPDGRLLAFDRDPEAIAFARRRLGELADRVTFVNASFDDMAELAPQHGFSEVDGILLDLGLSSRQLSDAGRGFSFLREGPLDMRFDPAQQLTAADLVNNLPEAELADIFRRYGEERNSRHWARLIIANRPITTTSQLAQLVAGQSGRRRERIHPATQIFQALRIAVNEELAALEKALPAAVELLMAGGRLAVISFHSLEDRMVKQFMRDQSRSCVCPPEQPVCTCATVPRLRLVGRKAIKPSDAEVAGNPRSRSARLRVAEKLN